MDRLLMAQAVAADSVRHCWCVPDAGGQGEGADEQLGTELEFLHASLHVPHPHPRPSPRPPISLFPLDWRICPLPPFLPLSATRLPVSPLTGTAPPFPLHPPPLLAHPSPRFPSYRRISSLPLPFRASLCCFPIAKRVLPGLGLLLTLLLPPLPCLPV
ncbi:unnamed protein product [Closterium sp. Naga37s-1]|nr:unnamed protein product [Closterium sp. Naga37s-1]